MLLDTPILLWWVAADPALPRRAAEVISDADTTVVVSAATAWEIAVKKAAGRLEAPDDLLDALEANDFESIAITIHALAAGRLRLHHSDPFRPDAHRSIPDRTTYPRQHRQTSLSLRR